MKDTEIKVNNKTVGEYDMIPDDNRPDWNQMYSTKPNYIKNRPIYVNYTDYCVADPVDIFGKEAGFMFKVVDPALIEEPGPGPNSIAYSRSYHIEPLVAGLTYKTKYPNLSPYRPRLKQQFYNTQYRRDFTAYWELNRLGLDANNNYLKIYDIGSGKYDNWGQNRRIDIVASNWGNMEIFRVYVIDWADFLNDEYKTKFTDLDHAGIYVELVNMPRYVDKYCKISFEMSYYNQIDEYYLPFNMADTIFSVPNTTSADANKILTIDSDGKPVWKITYEVPATTTADAGKILTVGADGIPVWVTPTTTTPSTEETT